MTLTRRTLLQSLAALLPLSALGLGRAPTLPISRLPEPAEGGAASAWGEALRREVERPSGLPALFRDCSGPPGSGKAIIVHTTTTIDPDCKQTFTVNGEEFGHPTPGLRKEMQRQHDEAAEAMRRALSSDTVTVIKGSAMGTTESFMLRHLKGGAG